MRVYAKSALLLLVAGPACISALAQQNPERPNAPYHNSGLRQSAPDFRLLTVDEGLAVLAAALDTRHHRGFTSDCSHFVHGLYERAGFPYAYAASSDLYTGIDQFERVTTPQAGDLVVWPGHVGIVVSSVQHSFFSLLRSGAGVEPYDSAYWRRRGHPRFFRYVKGNPATGRGTSLRNASLNPAHGEDAASEERTADDSESSRADDFSPTNDRRPARTAGAQAATATITQVVVVNTPHPTPEQVRAAFMQSCADSEESLRGRDFFSLTRPVVVFDHFIVRKLHIAGEQGWAEVEIDERVSVTAGKSEARTGAERQRWPLIHRGHTVWELTPPQRTIYLPQEIAAHLTAQRLAQLTKGGEIASDRNQKTELAQLLNLLLQK